MSDIPQLRLGSWEALAPLAAPVRVAVFVKEQGIPAELEWDEADAASLHCVARLGDAVVGTGRLLPDGHIGRMAVLPAWRGRGVGGIILEALVDAARERGHDAVELSAQVAVRAFYHRHGFTALGEVYEEVGIPHQRMPVLAEVARALSLTERFNGLTRGVIALRDAVFFASFIGFWLFVNAVVLDHRKAD